MPRRLYLPEPFRMRKSLWTTLGICLGLCLLSMHTQAQADGQPPAHSSDWMKGSSITTQSLTGKVCSSNPAVSDTLALSRAAASAADSASTPVLSPPGIAGGDGPGSDTVGWTRLPSGARYQDIYPGKGKTPSPGVAVHLHMKIYNARGKLIQNTFADRAAYIFTFGRNEVFPAFEEAIASMREGGKRRIVFPPEIGFWNAGYDDEERNVHIERDATLIFDVSFMWLREPEFDKIGRFK